MIDLTSLVKLRDIECATTRFRVRVCITLGRSITQEVQISCVGSVFSFFIRLDVPTVETQWLSLILTPALHA